ncbi:acylhydrolase [Hahella sp. CCB-MM4]|uniref:SGNH/GDSL hydrolase family protein n=1 Tax=Hahella sp. (strain CCB-MM4) TaxID=1926491 RepID=UPI000B9B72AE|nr:SGNH/GDSL hydrolase family protein [Hahella sp. CCB-MM4]OZG74814.1 acylhydrolase [Hahella sp. CCB-MM4]
MTHIALLGDSVFDNASYVDPGESVSDQLSAMVDRNSSISLLAIDGDITSDVTKQLLNLPQDVTHLFVSCGGNDALRAVEIINKSVSTVGEALEELTLIREAFKDRYREMLSSILSKAPNLTVCTVYNSVPGITERALTALALFNEVILQEAVSLGLPVIDLRILCNEESDYSTVSPIEPSAQGSAKIAAMIDQLVRTHDYGANESRIYSALNNPNIKLC